MSGKKILLIEDDIVISDFVYALLTANEFDVIHLNAGKDVMNTMMEYPFDLVLLDLGLPDIDGIDLLKQMRLWCQIPVIVISARGQETDKVQALYLGADDYLVKPFGAAELVARMRTAMRHHQNSKIPAAEISSVVTVGDLVIDYDKRLVTLSGKRVHLTPIEYKIVVLLAKNLGKVLTYDQINKEVWGPYSSENLSLRVNMAHIRRKIEKEPAEPVYIITEIGVGYRMMETRS